MPSSVAIPVLCRLADECASVGAFAAIMGDGSVITQQSDADHCRDSAAACSESVAILSSSSSAKLRPKWAA